MSDSTASKISKGLIFISYFDSGDGNIISPFTIHRKANFFIANESSNFALKTKDAIRATSEPKFNYASMTQSMLLK
jgi:hypothetical protein